MMTKVLPFLGLETVLLGYYLKMKNLELKKKRNSNLYLQSLAAFNVTIIKIIRCHYCNLSCFWAKGILFGDQSSYFPTNGLIDGPRQNCEVGKMFFFLVFPIAPSFFLSLEPFQSTLQSESHLPNLVFLCCFLAP